MWIPGLFKQVWVPAKGSEWSIRYTLWAWDDFLRLMSQITRT